MTTKTVAFVVSLAANAALAGSVVWVARHPGSASALTAWFHHASAPAPAAAPAIAQAAPAEARPANWAGLAQGDLPSLVARLRSLGFPPDVVRAIVAAQVHEQYRGRIKDLMAQLPNTPFWRQRQGFMIDPKINTALRALNREESAAVKDLVGSDPQSDNEIYAAYQKSQFGELPPEKMGKAQDIAQDYNDLRSSIYQNSMGGVMLPSDRKQLAYLQQQEDSDLANVLTPDEMLQYQMRSSQTASQLRNSLQAFNATEDEYKTIFQIQQAAQGATGPQFGPLTPEEQQQQQAAQTAANSQIEAALGSARYAEYKQDTDQGYVAAYRVAQRLNLPPEAPAQVYAVQQDITQQATAIRQDTALSSTDRNAQLAALGQTASSRVSAILGPDGTTAYQQSGGYWIQSLQNRARTARTAP